MKTLDNNNGFSMVEALVATAIVASTAMAGLAIFKFVGGAKGRDANICRIHASSIVEKFQSIGYFAAVSNFTPVSSSRSFSGTTMDSLSTKGIQDSMLWPSSIDVLTTTPKPTLNNSILISSSINALLAIYNSNSAYCTSEGGAIYTNSASDLFTKPSENLKNASVKIKIVPYDIRTGALITTCPTPLRIAPEPKYLDGGSNSPFVGTLAKVQKGNTQYQTGLVLTVFEEYLSDTGTPSSCSVEQKFQYAPDMNPPLPPDYKAIVPIPNWATSCTSASNSYDVIFGYSTLNIEPGSVMVCRDTSVIGTVAPGYQMTSCSGPGAPSPTVLYPIPNPPSSTGLTFGTYAAINADPSRQWVPCDKVTACGVSPASATLEPTSTAARPRYRLRYNNLPPYCRVNIQVATLDTASNSSDNVMTASVVGNPTVFNSASTIIAWDIPMPKCGSTCGSCGTNCGVTSASVYFRCGGCP